MSAEVQVIDKLGSRLIMGAGEDDCVLRVRWGISSALPTGKGVVVWNSDSVDRIIEAAIKGISEWPLPETEEAHSSIAIKSGGV